MSNLLRASRVALCCTIRSWILHLGKGHLLPWDIKSQGEYSISPTRHKLSIRLVVAPAFPTLSLQHRNILPLDCTVPSITIEEGSAKTSKYFHIQPANWTLTKVWSSPGQFRAKFRVGGMRLSRTDCPIDQAQASLLLHFHVNAERTWLQHIFIKGRWFWAGKRVRHVETFGRTGGNYSMASNNVLMESDRSQQPLGKIWPWGDLFRLLLYPTWILNLCRDLIWFSSFSEQSPSFIGFAMYIIRTVRGSIRYRYG